jgi:hypothetical protein
VGVEALPLRREPPTPDREAAERATPGGREHQEEPIEVAGPARLGRAGTGQGQERDRTLLEDLDHAGKMCPVRGKGEPGPEPAPADDRAHNRRFQLAMSELPRPSPRIDQVQEPLPDEPTDRLQRLDLAER